MSFKAARPLVRVLGLLLVASFLGLSFSAQAQHDNFDDLFGEAVSPAQQNFIYESWCNQETQAVMSSDSQGQPVLKYDCAKSARTPYCKESVVYRFGNYLIRAHCSQEKPIN